MQIVRRNQNPIVPLHLHSHASLVRNLVNFVRDIAVLQIAAHTDAFALVRALPNQRQRFIGRQFLFRKLLHQLHITVGALRKTTPVFRFALRTEHNSPRVYSMPASSTAFDGCSGWASAQPASRSERSGNPSALNPRSIFNLTLRALGVTVPPYLIPHNPQ